MATLDASFQTKWFTLFFGDNGRIQLTSDGWVECREYSSKEVKALIHNLEDKGWRLMASFDRKPPHGLLDAMELFFRRELKAAP